MFALEFDFRLQNYRITPLFYYYQARATYCAILRYVQHMLQRLRCTVVWHYVVLLAEDTLVLRIRA